MALHRLLITYPIALAIFFAIDMVWLGWLSGDFYERHIGHLLGPVNWFAALAFYLLFIAGIVIFSVRAGLEAQSPRRAAIWGALYGFFTYATYDLTNMATLRDWPVILVFVDIAWGVFICASVGFLTTATALKISNLAGE